MLRTVGLGLITGAADADCSAIGTFASAGAKFGSAFFWTAPFLFPMMFTVVYLSARLGQVSGKGLFQVIRDECPRWILYSTLVMAVCGNIFEAGADLRGMAAGINLLAPVPIKLIAVVIAIIILTLQIFAPYRLIRNIFRWLSLSLLAYIGAAVLARPDVRDLVIGTLVPRIQFNREFLSLLVAVIGATLSAYLYTWESNQEVEEKKAKGRKKLAQRRGTSFEELKHTRIDVISGMFFSSLILYFIMVATGSTLHQAGVRDVTSAAQAAEALRPLAGNLATWLFTLGLVAVGFLAFPIMTAGAAYDLAQVVHWPHGLNRKFTNAKSFYSAIVGFTVIAVAMNFLEINPMKMLVWSGIVQGFSTPPLLLLMMLITNRRSVMGDKVNSRAMNVLGWATTVCVFAATGGLIITWII